MSNYVFDFEKRSGEKSSVNLTTVELMEAYISDPESYKTEEFCFKHQIPKSKLGVKANNVKENHKELFDLFIQTKLRNKVINRRIIESNIDEIILGIIYGSTSDGEPFTVNEFYKRLPFIGSDFYQEFRSLVMSFPDLKDGQKIKQDYCNRKRENGDYSPLSYSDNFNILVELLRPKYASIVSKYIKENNIVRVNPIHRIAFINGCKNNPASTITEEECIQIFSYMDEKGYPCILEVFNNLKQTKEKARVRKD